MGSTSGALVHRLPGDAARRSGSVLEAATAAAGRREGLTPGRLSTIQVDRIHWGIPGEAGERIMATDTLSELGKKKASMVEDFNQILKLARRARADCERIKDAVGWAR